MHVLSPRPVLLGTTNVYLDNDLLMLERCKALAPLQEIVVSAQETGNPISQLCTEVRLGHVALRAGNLSEAHQPLIQFAIALTHQVIALAFFASTIFFIHCLRTLDAERT